MKRPEQDDRNEQSPVYELGTGENERGSSTARLKKTKIKSSGSMRRKAPADLDQAAEAGRLLLASMGENLDREGLARTPSRFAKAMAHLTSGYRMTPKEAVGDGIFTAEGSGLVAVKDIEFYSMCEHHLLPFWGKASVAYYPNKKIVGLSKIPRLVNLYARRFQVQERMTNQITKAVFDLISPRAVFCRVSGCHMCMMMRGVEKQLSTTVTEGHLDLEKLTDFERDQLVKSLA